MQQYKMFQTQTKYKIFHSWDNIDIKPFTSIPSIKLPQFNSIPFWETIQIYTRYNIFHNLIVYIAENIEIYTSNKIFHNLIIYIFEKH